MKMIVKIALFLGWMGVLSLFPLRAYPGEGTYVKYHVNAIGGSHSDAKALSFGHQSEVLSWLDSKLEAGAYFDKRPGARSSAFGMAALGVEPTAGAFYVNFFQGVGGISSPDDWLGGHFQFFEEIGLGIRDQREGTSVGLFFKHISSAGIYERNKGRDFIGIKVQIPF